MKPKSAKPTEQSIVAHIDSIRDKINELMKKAGYDQIKSRVAQFKKKRIASGDKIIEKMTFTIYACWFFRVQKGLSQQQLADRCGISRSTISRFENGDVNTSGILPLHLSWAMQLTDKEIDELIRQKVKEYKSQVAALKAKKNKKR